MTISAYSERFTMFTSLLNQWNYKLKLWDKFIYSFAIRIAPYLSENPRLLRYLFDGKIRCINEHNEFANFI